MRMEVRGERKGYSHYSSQSKVFKTFGIKGGNTHTVTSHVMDISLKEISLKIKEIQKDIESLFCKLEFKNEEERKAYSFLKGHIDFTLVGIRGVELLIEDVPQEYKKDGILKDVRCENLYQNPLEVIDKLLSFLRSFIKEFLKITSAQPSLLPLTEECGKGLKGIVGCCFDISAFLNDLWKDVYHFRESVREEKEEAS